MKIYLEYVIIDNFIFDYLLLLATFYKRGEKTKKGKIIFSSIIGTAISVVFPLLKLHEIVLFFLKITTAFFLVFLAGEFLNFKSYFISVNKFILLTFLFGGSIYGIFSILSIDYAFLYGTSNSLIPLGFIIILAIGLYYFTKKIYQLIFFKKIINAFSCKCTLYFQGNKVDAIGYFDSGNHLSYKNIGVSFACSSLCKKLYYQGYFNCPPIGELNIYTATGKKRVAIYQFDKLEIYFNQKRNIIYKPKIAISRDKTKFGQEYDLILSCDYLS